MELSSGHGELSKALEGVVNNRALSLEPVSLGLWDLDIDCDLRAFSCRFESPLEAQVGDQTRHGDALLLTLGVEELGHREVRVAVGVHRVIALLLNFDRPDSGPPIREARRVVEQLPDLLGRSGA